MKTDEAILIRFLKHHRLYSSYFFGVMKGRLIKDSSFNPFKDGVYSLSNIESYEEYPILRDCKIYSSGIRNAIVESVSWASTRCPDKFDDIFSYMPGYRKYNSLYDLIKDKHHMDNEYYRLYHEKTIQ